MLRQTFVTIINSTTDFNLPENLVNAEIISCPDFVSAKKENCHLSITGKNYGRGQLILKDKDNQINLRIACFKEKEAFMVTAISCNYHNGWNPGIQNEVGHINACGPDMYGNAFNYALNMEGVLHRQDFPITWLMDAYSYKSEADSFRKFSDMGDEIGYMPSSYSHFNSLNYNLFKSDFETFKILEGGKAHLTHLCGKAVRSMGIDQFIGSIGTNMVQAANKMGINALWGIGIDHHECDTSMFHFGCPWNPYKSSKANFRIPGENNQHPWIFDWTYRDLLNTVRVPGIASGSVMFSTDVDDIYNCKIAQNQKDYYNRLAQNLIDNLKYNEFVVFLVHQEDHDSGDLERCEYLENFYSTIPSGYTKATMGEVADWLDIKYPGKAQPTQTLYLEDQIENHDEVFFYCGAAAPKPTDWPAKNEKYPPHVAYYDKDSQLIYEYNSPAPYRYIDYSKQLPVPEHLTCEEEILPMIGIKELELEDNYIYYKIMSSADYDKFPLAIWTDKIPDSATIKLTHGFVIFIPLITGTNIGRYEL